MDRCGRRVVSVASRSSKEKGKKRGEGKAVCEFSIDWLRGDVQHDDAGAGAVSPRRILVECSPRTYGPPRERGRNLGLNRDLSPRAGPIARKREAAAARKSPRPAKSRAIQYHAALRTPHCRERGVRPTRPPPASTVWPT